MRQKVERRRCGDRLGEAAAEPVAVIAQRPTLVFRHQLEAGLCLERLENGASMKAVPAPRVAVAAENP